jgi:hypothetical protein
MVLLAPVARSGTISPRGYAHRLTLVRWHSEAEWRSLDAIVTPESGWNPCRRFPSTTDCFYTGSNSCGLPQANPCPREWRGRLAKTWRAQVRWLIGYITHRYGSPSRALAFRRTNGWY